jgi:hypothetical protein
MTWLITWRGTSREDYPRQREVVAVLHGNVGVDRVRSIIEALYPALTLSEEDIVRRVRFEAEKAVVEGVRT